MRNEGDVGVECVRDEMTSFRVIPDGVGFHCRMWVRTVVMRGTGKGEEVGGVEDRGTQSRRYGRHTWSE